ncbi:MAG: hypothetical protein HYY79_05015, partial [Betaproteobacteria bacterium]|nr:hypothetical protein [Betaproteobacteria bacterium]
MSRGALPGGSPRKAAVHHRQVHRLRDPLHRHRRQRSAELPAPPIAVQSGGEIVDGERAIEQRHLRPLEREAQATHVERERERAEWQPQQLAALEADFGRRGAVTPPRNPAADTEQREAALAVLDGDVREPHVDRREPASFEPGLQRNLALGAQVRKHGAFEERLEDLRIERAEIEFRRARAGRRDRSRTAIPGAVEPDFTDAGQRHVRVLDAHLAFVHRALRDEPLPTTREIKRLPEYFAVFPGD